MKKIRIISLILVLSLIFGALSVLPVSAVETATASTAVDILAQNVVYNEKVQIAYAVNVPIAEAENVTVEYYLEDEPETIHKAELLDVNNPSYVYEETNPVFATIGFHATDFTDVVYATAYIGDKAPENAVYKRYSVAEYFYSRLYKDDYINKNEGADADRKDLYLSMIDYGKYAQKVLVINKGGETTLITDYCYLWTADETITINGSKSTLLAPGAEVTFAGADSYTVTPVGGESASAEASYTAVAGVIAEIAAESVVDSYAVMDYQGGVPYSDYVESYDSDGNKITGAYPTASANLMMGLASTGDNSYLQVRNVKGSNLTGTTKVQISNTVPTGNCYTFEAAITINGASAAGNNFARVKIVNVNGGDALNLILGTDSNKKLKIAVSGSPTGGVASGDVLFNSDNASIAVGDWFTLRVEFYFAGAGTATAENTYMKLYVGENLAYEGLASWAVGSDITYAQIDHISSGATHNISYDDIFFTQTDKTY